MIIVFSFLVALIGLLIYGFAANAKLSEVGRIMFFCGMLVFTMQFGSTAKTLLGR